MKERPIIFSSEMVRAILDGRKTQTRRPCAEHLQIYKAANFMRHENEWDFYFPQGVGQLAKCPYGRPGDRLWVRESFGKSNGLSKKIFYKSDGAPSVPAVVWKPSIHMPRWASRITLEVINVKVERLQDISEEDAKAEGIVISSPATYQRQFNCAYWRIYRDAFYRLWDSIYGEGQHTSKNNPWVWAIEFKVISSREGNNIAKCNEHQ